MIFGCCFFYFIWFSVGIGIGLYKDRNADVIIGGDLMFKSNLGLLRCFIK